MEGKNVRRGRRQEGRKDGNREEDRQHYIDTNRGKEGKLDCIAKRVCVRVRS